MGLIKYLDKHSKLFWVILAFMFVALIGAIDYTMGPADLRLILVTKLIYLFIFIYVLSELKNALKRERELITMDSLTKVANRKCFYDMAGSEINRLRRYKRPFTVAYMDIDNLKMINYRFGYSIGDSLLQSVAQTIKNDIRNVDLVSRFGGDEFALLMPETGAEGAQVVLSRLRSQLLEAMQKKDWPVTFSFGAVTFMTPPDSIEEMMRKAGVLMYSAKNLGPNMIDQEVFECR